MKLTFKVLAICLLFAFEVNTLQAQEDLIGEVRLFAGNFAPENWAFCNGQLLAISSNTSLFSILGSTYGGDGRTTFALPDLRGRVPVSPGRGPGLTNYNLGQKTGNEYTTLTTSNLPSHNHTVIINNSGSVDIPINSVIGNEDESNPEVGYIANTGADNFASSASPNTKYTGNSLPVSGISASTTTTGGSTSFDNRQPTLGLHYIICLFGVYPVRN